MQAGLKLTLGLAGASGKVRRLLLLTQVVQFIHQPLGFGSGFFYNTLCLLTGTIDLLFPTSMDVFQFFLALSGGTLCSLTSTFGSHNLLLQLLTTGIQTGDHLFQTLVVTGHQTAGILYQICIHTQPLGDGEGIGTSGHTDKQTVGRTQRGYVKLTASILYTGGMDGISLQLGIVGGGANACPLATQTLQNRHRQCRTLYRVGTGTQLIQQHHSALLRLAQDANDVGHVSREGGQGLLDGLLVADVHQNAREHRHLTVVPHRDQQTALGHQSEQTQCFQRNGFTTGVRTGNHQGVKLAT